MSDRGSTNNSSNESGAMTAPQRFPTKEHAQFEVYGKAGTVHCRLANLSATGALLEIITAKNKPQQGDIIRISVNLRQINKTHALDAEIVWCKEKGLGIAFLKKDQIYEKLAHRAANTSNS